MNIETELADIKRLLNEKSWKLDELIEEKEITAMMKLSEASLKDFSWRWARYLFDKGCED